MTSVTFASYDKKPTGIKHCTSSEQCGKRSCCRGVDGKLVGVKNEGKRVPGEYIHGLHAYIILVD